MFTRVLDVSVRPDDVSPHLRRRIFIRHVIVGMTSLGNLKKTFTPWAEIARGLEPEQAFTCACSLLELNLPLDVGEIEEEDVEGPAPE